MDVVEESLEEGEEQGDHDEHNRAERDPQHKLQCLEAMETEDPELTVPGQSHGPREQSRMGAGAWHSNQEQQPSASRDLRNLVDLNAETQAEISRSTRVESYSTDVLGTDTQCGTDTVPKTSTSTDS
eukprot:SAG11_NODE_17140_length_527_cov_0.964953_2_plen_126_part_01